MPPLPAAYQWLANPSLRPLPLMVDHALAEFGTIETAGPGNNPKILAWAQELGLASTYSADSIPWCGLFMAMVATRALKPVPEKPLWALSWAAFGEASPSASLGDVLVFKRDGGGHVGLYVGHDQTAFHVLGGNQADQVCFTRIARSRLRAVRRPIYRARPASARPFVLAPSGSLSRNEA